jgi:hypothetical protein
MLDGYVRIPETELQDLRIQHLTSAVDMSIAIAETLAEASPHVITGYTEWTGEWYAAAVSLALDWGLIHGEVLLINLPEMRTNIQLVSQDGQARSPLLCRLRLAQYLETVAWQDVIRRDCSFDDPFAR